MPSSTLSHLLASANPCLSFMSHSHRRNSALFFKLFNIELLRVDGFSRHSFSPPISLPKQIPHEKRLKELNLVNGLLYAVSIRPARSIELGSVEVGGATDAEGRGLEAQCLLPFVFWMNLIGKQNASKKTCKVLEELCPESSSSALRVVDGSTPIGELSTLSLEEVFIIVREELKHLQSYEKYKETKREICGDKGFFAADFLISPPRIGFPLCRRAAFHIKAARSVEVAQDENWNIMSVD
ncbi:hypothetical protein KIN20_000282 [Parelaphostrongylus tenuis]|uniref:Uncharacterized protein n=1 Tax=Parelaphostrongylus tenuis TaxID=148309 RepID=A0AAD5MDE0_PARTN|nr:hypothetical protein KIN20_000282 [Parelaphostrongylus tenuis]